MNKRVLRITCLSLVVVMSGLEQKIFAQVLASTHAQDVYQPVEVQKTGRAVSLKKILSDLEGRFHVTFAFDENLIRDRRAVVVGGSSVESILDQILTPQGLRYRKVKDTIYVILEASEKSALAPVLLPASVDPKVESARVAARRITGTVTDEQGGGIPGATVLEQNTTNGTTTDANGRFTLNVSDNATAVVISSIGFQTQTIPVTTQTEVNVTLTADVRSLNEVVVVGYGTQRRGDLTGAIGIVDTKELRKIQTAQVGEQLQGRVAGVNVISTGQPGASPIIKIRGTGTFGGNSAPLWVIDGLQVSDPGREFNPNDVESIQVLKDASATALYGSRGMNGVIIVTTKRGKNGAPRVDFSTYAGVQSIPRRLPLTNAAEFTRINNLAYSNAGLQPLKLRQGVDTDWQDEFFKQGAMTDNTLTVSGGTQNSNYLISANYFFQDGTVVGPSFRRYQIRANTEMKKGRFTIGQTLSLGRTNTRLLNGNPFIDLMRMLPTIPVYDPTVPGGYGIGDPSNNTFGTNPIGAQKLNINTQLGNRIQGTIYTDIRIFDYLTYRLQGSLEYQSYFDQGKFQSGRISQNQVINPPTLSETRGERFNPQIEQTLTFNKDFGVHHVDALVGYTRYSTNLRFTSGTVQGTPANIWVLRAGTISPVVGGEEFASSLISYLARVNYSYQNKYLLQANFRRDGSSKFSRNDLYGNFPSASVGWRISEEAFLKDNVDWINDLKIRASYGTVGNQNIPEYEIQQFINPNVTYVLGNSQSIVPGAINTRLTNPNLRWESKTQLDVGFDANLFNNRITVGFDYYHAKSKDLLTRVPIPLTAGSSGENPYENIASMQNKGVELSLGYNGASGKPLQYSLFGTFTTVRNKVLGLVPANNNQPIFGWGGVTRTAIGHPVGEFYLLRMDGIFQTQEEIDNSAQKGSATPGDIRWKDVNGDGKIDLDNDREYAGSPFPKFEYSLNATASFKGFDATAYFYGVYGNSIFSPMRYWTGRYDDPGSYRTDEQPWTGPGTSNTVPKPVIGDPTLNATFLSDRWLESGSYLRMRSLQIGYSLPAKTVSRWKVVSSLRVYVSAQNLFTITKYKGYNPEVPGPDPILGRSVDDGSYPGSRILTGGLQVSF
ncbi:SusC/RagA family TonB-linked outer membrane protein [Larkinella soli]|uniref:SusC/RagA family TonB-linked outer membrane protein n=1 Tax=Larkinella soli TaxID=1770527 RepID=UPI000FFBD7C7|nr:SusC/RagA family TonB-linked outer membrane protein [Larkinella soli]